MFRNYLKIAFRNLVKDKIYVAINIFGLAIGMGVCFIIAFYIQGELSYDTFHEKEDRIYRLTESRLQSGELFEKSYTAYSLAQQLESDVPEIETIVTVLDRTGELVLTDGTSMFSNLRHHYTESEFFDVFDIELLLGDKKDLLDDPSSIVLSEQLALKIFGTTNVIGKEVKRAVYQEDGEMYTITGVFKEVPSNSHFQFDALRSFESMLSTGISLNNAQFYNYALLNSESDLEIVAKKTNDVTKNHFGKEYVENRDLSIAYEPLTSIYLGSLRAQKKGNPAYIPIFFTIAIFILLIAIINYMNLAIARSIDRGKEVGIRKVVGASRFDLIKQFLGESLLYSLIAIPFALVIVDLFLPYFNNLMNASIIWDVSKNYSLILTVGLAVVLTGLFSSLYPAFILSSFKPIQIFKNGIDNSMLKGVSLRKGLIIAQFVATSLLIISTVIMSKQLEYIQQRNLGFDEELLISVDIGYPNQRPPSDIVKASFEKNPFTKNVSRSFNKAGNIEAQQLIDLTREDSLQRSAQVVYERIDSDYLFTLGLNILAGRDFIADNELDGKESIIINETALKSLGWDNAQDAIGKQVKSVYIEYETIIAVVEDFHFESVHTEISPLALHTNVNAFPFYQTMTIRLTDGSVSQAINSLEETWDAFNTGTPFEYVFSEDAIGKLYEKEKKISSLFDFFALISIAISSIGLLGLSAFTAQRRTKEIGIRKVLGASLSNIIGLLSKDFLSLVILGFIISVPITWYIMNSWLTEFAYRIEIGVDTFLIAGLAIILVAFCTVSWQSIKAALANPVDSLKSE